MQGNTTLPIPQYSRLWEQITSGFLVLVIIAALLGNGFVCAAVYRVRRLQKPSNYFLVSLAASDILVALFSIPFRIYTVLNSSSGWLLGKHTCQFWIFIDLLCCSASIVNLSLVSVDRYIALSRPLRYLMIMTVQRCKMSILCVWLFSFTISILSVHTWSKDGYVKDYPVCLKQDKIYYTIITILAMLIPLTILMVLYCLVFKMAWEQNKKIYRTSNSFRSQGSISENVEPFRSSGVSRRLQFAMRELKAAKTLIIVVGTFLVCWLPFFILFLLQQYSPIYITRLSPKTQEILGQLFFYALPHLNSALNPYIYTVFNTEFRDVFKDKLMPFLRSKFKDDIRNPSQV